MQLIETILYVNELQASAEFCFQFFRQNTDLMFRE